MFGEDLKPGMKVTFLGWIPEQVTWARTDEPTEFEPGETYYIESVAIRSSHTRVTIEGYSGTFNSVHFAPTVMDTSLPPIEPWLPKVGDIVVFQKWCYNVTKVEGPTHIELDALDGVFTTEQLSPL